MWNDIWKACRKRDSIDKDPDNPEYLIAADASLNRSKSDKGPDKWMPPDTDYHCQYVSDWEAIKQRWALDMSVREAEAMAAIKENYL